MIIVLPDSNAGPSAQGTHVVTPTRLAFSAGPPTIAIRANLAEVRSSGVCLAFVQEEPSGQFDLSFR